MMVKRTTRLLAVFLSCIMLFGILPVQAFAEEEFPDSNTQPLQEVLFNCAQEGTKIAVFCEGAELGSSASGAWQYYLPAGSYS